VTEEQIFLAVLDLPDATARAAYLDETCGSDTMLRRQVEALLASHFRSGEFLDVPAAEQIKAGSTSENTVTMQGDAVSAEKKPDDESDDLHFLTPSARPDSLGRIGHYEVLQVLGQGGFGIVFRAFDEVLQRVVAVKVMTPQLAATSPARKRFLREARTSAQVRHENVVQVYEVAESPLPYLAMEFIPGETLQQRLDRIGPIEPAEVVRIGRQIAEGLAAAHATDLIHRDIKPANVLLEGGQQRVKITDFGLARAADDASISQSGIIAGTPMYMAPEQAKGDKLDQRADLFSLGSVLYQMAAGRPPFRANNTVAVLKRVADDTPRDIREIVPETPQWLCDIIAKLHAKSPDDRYQSAREVADVLADCEAQLKANSKLKDFSRIPRGKSRRSGRRKWVAAAAVLLLPVIALAVTEFAGVTHLFRGQQVAGDPVRPGGDPTPVAKQEPLPPTFKNNIGMEFVIVPKGKSWLGGGKDRLGDKEVEIPADFYLGKYEVTQEEWEKVMGENPSAFSRAGGNKDAVKDISDVDLKRFPVEQVSWDQCQVFIAKLNQREKETGWVYRLPTGAEWEYACRGGPMTDKADSAHDFCVAKPTNTLLPEQANFDNGEKALKRTCKAGSYPPNQLGLYDMHGNVSEWCQEEIAPGPKDPKDAVLWRHRGGSWWNDARNCRLENRLCGQPFFRNEILGLRLARVPSGAPSPEAKTPPLAIAPFTDADVKRIAALPAAEQVEEVRKELMRRNPGFDGKFDHKIEDGVVTELRIVTDKVTDIAPIRVFNALRDLECSGTWTNGPNGVLADLTPLEGMNLAGLDRLCLGNTKVTDAGMAIFKDCKNLVRLELWFTNLTDAGVAHFKDCKNLTSLNLGGTRVSDAGLAHFKDCKNLVKLELWCKNLTDAGLAHFKDCKNLNLLNVAETHVTDAGLIQFKDCKALTHLYLGGTKEVTDAGLAQFKGTPLVVLWIQNTGITDLSPLHDMPLREIRLTPKKITQGLDLLRSMKSLKTIGAEVDKAWPAAEFWERYDKGEFTQAMFPDRRAAEYVLSIGGVIRIDGGDREIRAAAQLPKEAFRLTDVDLNFNKQVTDAGLAAFKDCTSVTALGLYACGQVTDAGLAHFKDCKDLSLLYIEGVGVTDAALAVFANYKNLTVLQLGNTRVTDAGLAHLQDIKSLTSIQLLNQPVTDAGLAHLKNCKNLTHLDLRGTQVTDAGLAHFKDCKDLSVLWLGSTSITDVGLALFKDCQNLTQLDLAGTSITDDGVARVKGHKSLTSLDLQGTPVTDAALAYLAKMDKLIELNLAKTKVTAKGVEGLAKALPKCKIAWDGGVIEPK
jgi:serine/threonine protein kinase/Leucine-rich repeat (LRR) protein